MQPVTKRKNIKVQISIPEDLLERVDRDVSSKHFLNRSGWFSLAALKLLDESQRNDIDALVTGRSGVGNN